MVEATNCLPSRACFFPLFQKARSSPPWLIPIKKTEFVVIISNGYSKRSLSGSVPITISAPMPLARSNAIIRASGSSDWEILQLVFPSGRTVPQPNEHQYILLPALAEQRLWMCHVKSKYNFKIFTSILFKLT